MHAATLILLVAVVLIFAMAYSQSEATNSGYYGSYPNYSGVIVTRPVVYPSSNSGWSGSWWNMRRRYDDDDRRRRWYN